MPNSMYLPHVMANPNNLSFQLGLLHFVHLLVTVDGHIDDRERKAIAAICKEENIADSIVLDFQTMVETMKEQEIYTKGVEYLNQCSEEERLTAFVHLYKLAEADTSISNKEVRFLLYGLKVTNISFEDVVLSAGMSGQKQ
ncbi:MAG: hypothetical protein ACOYXA_14500 [Bacteroidota bacterium]